MLPHAVLPHQHRRVGRRARGSRRFCTSANTSSATASDGRPRTSTSRAGRRQQMADHETTATPLPGRSTGAVAITRGCVVESALTRKLLQHLPSRHVPGFSGFPSATLPARLPWQRRVEREGNQTSCGLYDGVRSCRRTIYKDIKAASPSRTAGSAPRRRRRRLRRHCCFSKIGYGRGAAALGRRQGGFSGAGATGRSRR